MSYSTDLKHRLALKETKKNCCRKALLYGMLSVRGEEKEGAVTLSLDTGSVSELALSEIRRIFDASAYAVPCGRIGKRTRIFFHSDAILEHLSKHELSYPEKAPPCLNCLSHFLRGIFLAVGRMTDYTKQYRLEFSAAEHTDSLATILGETVFAPNQTVRRDEVLLYYKSNSAICDFLAVIGAEPDAFALINDNIEAGYRNAANRRANCEARNIERSVEASMKVVHLIRRLTASDKLGKLPEELRETARLRVENPTVSLTTLGSWCTPPVSKSGINHRLKKIEELATELLVGSEGEE